MKRLRFKVKDSGIIYRILSAFIVFYSLNSSRVLPHIKFYTTHRSGVPPKRWQVFRFWNNNKERSIALLVSHRQGGKYRRRQRQVTYINKQIVSYHHHALYVLNEQWIIRMSLFADCRSLSIFPIFQKIANISVWPISRISVAMNNIFTSITNSWPLLEVILYSNHIRPFWKTLLYSYTHECFI